MNSKYLFWGGLAAFGVLAFVYFKQRPGGLGSGGFAGALPSGIRPPRLVGTGGFRNRHKDFPRKTDPYSESHTGLSTDD